MSFSRLLNTNSVYCLKYSLRKKQSLDFCLNVKHFHSINSVTNSPKLILNTTISHRCLSTVKADTTIDFKPETIENTIDLSGSISDTTSIVENLVNVSDLPITQLGLVSNYFPTGWVLHFLELLNGSLPWYATIAVATLLFRTAMFPLVIKAQRNALKMNQIMPKMQELQQKATNARLAGNQLEFSKYTMEVQKLLKDNGVNPIKSMIVPLAQAPIFISFFLCLRRMAQYPVESLKTGGILWFVDLTIPDPYHLLPVITAVTLWAALELGVESGVNAQSSAFIKMAIRVLPIVTLAFIWNFESAILMYWCSSNMISLLQVAVLRQKVIRNYLKLPLPIKHSPQDVQKKGFYKSFKEAMDNSKVFKKLEERKRIDEINFKKAAIGPIKRTFKTDPTKIPKQN